LPAVLTNYTTFHWFPNYPNTYVIVGGSGDPRIQHPNDF